MTGPRIPQDMVPVLLWAVSSLMADRHGAVPAEVRYAHRWLYTMSDPMSATRNTSDNAAESTVSEDLVRTSEAAVLIGCSERHVRRIARELYGTHRSGGRAYWFPRDRVLAHAQQRREDHREQLAKRSHPGNE